MTAISGASVPTYQIAGLAAFTRSTGSYALTVDASKIVDYAGNTGTGSASVSWSEAVVPTSVYVSSAYAGDAPGTTVAWTDGSSHVVGFDAFGTIQAGINGVAAGGTVNVAAGTYAEQLTISQSLSLIGAGLSSTTIQPPSAASGDEIEIAAGAAVALSGITVDPASSLTGIDVNGGSLSASTIAIAGFATGISIENAGAATITDSTVTGATTGIVVGLNAGDTSTLTATNDSFSGDGTGVQNNETTGTLTATDDWWGSATGPTITANPDGQGAAVSTGVNFSPWLGDANIVAPDQLVVLASTGNQFTITPASGNTMLSLTAGANTLGTITAGNNSSISFIGTGATVTINGESGTGSTDVFNIMNTSVVFGASDG